MKNKSILIAIAVIFSFLLMNNVSYGNVTDDPKCKCENCICGDNCTGDCKTCPGCENNCQNGKCDINGSSSGEIKERCCTKSSMKIETGQSGESQGINDSSAVCPVSGEKIEGSGVSYSYLGKEYTFCCENCISKFKAEPMSYIKTQLLCPVMGEPAEKDLYVTYNDTKYYFCCKPCIKKFNKEPEKYSQGYKGD